MKICWVLLGNFVKMHMMYTIANNEVNVLLYEKALRDCNVADHVMCFDDVDLESRQ